MSARAGAPLLALLVAACAIAPSEAEQAALRAATDRVRASLVEPKSAHFRNVALYEDGVVCGQVNGSVGMGLTGYERFVATRERVMLESQLPTQRAIDAWWTRHCR